MRGFANLSREYEERRFPPARRLDVHGEGPAVARDRALRWIQSHAHEAPGTELLLVVERGGRPGGRPGPVRAAVEALLRDLEGRLVEWWSTFAAGSIAVKVAADPRMAAGPGGAPDHFDPADGRTPDTAGAAMPPPDLDIPAELLPLARTVAEMRRDSEGLSLGLFEVVLRRVWIEAQALAMADRVEFADALRVLLDRERERAREAD
jgi:hypothetical protein